jgi:inactive STAND/Adenylate and Guanylate cyclase catalytic domain
MLTDQNENLTLEIAHVLFMDIVGYSKLLIEEQAQCLRKLQEVVRHTKEFRHANPQEQLIRLPTGDGMALVFFGDALAPVRCALEVSRALQSSPEVELRMGVHSGPVSRIVDINERVNVAGEGINFAQRVMDAGGKGHILVSRAVADVMHHVSGWAEYLHDLGEFKVKHGVTINIYNLYTGECGNPNPPERSHLQPAESAVPSRPSLGHIVFKLCDRGPHVRAFTDFFIAHLKGNTGRPLFCFIHGEEKECHDSLVERFVHVHIKPIAARIWGDQRNIAIFKKTRWPHEGDVNERQQELIMNLFAEFDPAYMDNDISAKALSRLVSLLLCPLVVIQHNIYGEQWDKSTRALIEWYMSYWGMLKSGHAGPQFLIFVNVLYPRDQLIMHWRLWPPSKGVGKKQIQSDLQQLCVMQADGCPSILLKELVTPPKHEVGDWFSQHNIYDVKTRVELLDRIFTGISPVTMADIEHELQKIHQEFVKKRGAW